MAARGSHARSEQGGVAACFPNGPVRTGGVACAVPENSAPNRAPSDAAAGQTAGAGSEPGVGAAVSPAIPRPPGNAIGVGPSHAGKPIESADIEVAVAPGVDPSAPGASASAASDDPQVAPLTAIGAGSARSAFVTLGLTALTVAITPDWAIQSDSPGAPEQGALPPGVALANASAFEPAASMTPDLPAPRGAGLITGLPALQASHLDDCLSRLLDRSGPSSEPSDQLARAYPYLVEVALAVFAVELTRRWRQRSTRTPRRARRSRFFVLSSLL